MSAPSTFPASVAAFGALYKQTTTSRGFSYRYHFSAPLSGKPTLLFIHSFPSLAVGLYKQASYFEERGYGVVVPDMLGYGGTDKPLDVSFYVQSGIARDLVDILDHEGLEDVIVFAHAWGTRAASALAQRHPDRFLGFGFSTLTYQPPNPSLTFQEMCSQAQASGESDNPFVSTTDWDLFSPGSDFNELILQNHEAFLHLVFAKDNTIWMSGPRKVLQSDGAKVELTEGVREKGIEHWKMEFARERGGYEGALNHVRAFALDYDMADAKDIPLANYTIDKPVFFAAATRDAICRPSFGKQAMECYCPKATIEEFNSGHWFIGKPLDELLPSLERWVESVVGGPPAAIN